MLNSLIYRTQIRIYTDNKSHWVSGVPLKLNAVAIIFALLGFGNINVSVQIICSGISVGPWPSWDLVTCL